MTKGSGRGFGPGARANVWQMVQFRTPDTMPSVSKNEQLWVDHHWSQAGDEWSEWWGTARTQWVGCLLPRVFPFLNGRILEIAPGYGRWTQFLQAHCTSLIGIDLTPACVERCTERFAQNPNLEFRVNDGLTFPMVENGSVDFAFSFDSLVHAESDVLASYAKELARVLKPGGVAFIHHSNLEAVSRSSVSYLARTVRQRLLRLPRMTPHWRARFDERQKDARIRPERRHVVRSTGDHSLGARADLDDRLHQHDRQYPRPANAR